MAACIELLSPGSLSAKQMCCPQVTCRRWKDGVPLPCTSRWINLSGRITAVSRMWQRLPTVLRSLNGRSIRGLVSFVDPLIGPICPSHLPHHPHILAEQCPKTGSPYTASLQLVRYIQYKMAAPLFLFLT